jgi:peptidoglycan-associated lipoprotein
MLRWLRLNPGMRFRVEGYSDQSGPEEANLRISRRRADAAVRWFVASGISRSRFDVVAYGETRPLCEESDRSCAQRERRAEFVVVTYGAERIVRPPEELPRR